MKKLYGKHFLFVLPVLALVLTGCSQQDDSACDKSAHPKTEREAIEKLLDAAYSNDATLACSAMASQLSESEILRDLPKLKAEAEANGITSANLIAKTTFKGGSLLSVEAWTEQSAKPLMDFQLIDIRSTGYRVAWPIVEQSLHLRRISSQYCEK